MKALVSVAAAAFTPCGNFPLDHYITCSSFLNSAIENMFPQFDVD
jgi:hypothetical protein